MSLRMSEASSISGDGPQARAATASRDASAGERNASDAWTAKVITLFPETFPGVLGASLTGRALREGIWRLDTIDLRRFGEGAHRNVDDAPAGGGAGMVLRADILGKALIHAEQDSPSSRDEWPIIALSPRGAPFTQARARALSSGRGATFVCGRFEGIDQRALDRFDVEEISVGDFVLTGGEIAAQALIDAAVRLIPDVLGNRASAEEESFSDGLLEFPQYTRPAVWEGSAIPEVLLSGHHAEIASWRRSMAERLTRKRRPDLWRAYCAERGMAPDGDRDL